MQGQSTARRYASQANPCPVCESTHGCSVGPDGLIFCRGKSGPIQGFRSLGQASGDPSWHLYRRTDDPVTGGNGASSARPALSLGAEKEKPKNPPRREWSLLCRDWASALTQRQREELATELGLPVWALDAIQWAGWNARGGNGGCWTFPLLDGNGEVIGAMRRWRSGQKGLAAGSQKGLIVVRDWEERGGPIYCPEGVSDTLACAALGLAALGRCDCTSGADQLAVMLAPHTGREIVVLADDDYKRETHAFPGRDGAIACAAQIARALGRPVSWAFPPPGFKDVRAWTFELRLEPSNPEWWAVLAHRFQAGLQLHEVRPDGVQKQGEGLSLRSLDQVEVAVMRWLVPGYIPAGEMVLLAGDGGEGKSLIALHIAARLTRGEPCFGLTYQPGLPRSVLLAACEDDAQTTHKPRLWAAGANMARVHLVEGAKLPDGTVAPFGLHHVLQLQAQLAQLPEVGMVIIDPVTAYLAGSGVDDSRDQEIRLLIEPLRIACRERGVVLWLVKHFNKGTGAKASARIAGSAGWRNASRAAYLVMGEPGVEGSHCFLPSKVSGAKLPESLLYRICLPSSSEVRAITSSLPADWPEEDRRSFEDQLARAEWYGITDWDADSICAEEVVRTHDEGPEAERAGLWLRKYLQGGAQPSQLCTDQGNLACSLGRSTKWWRDRVLKGQIAGKSLHGKGFDAGWYFCLPGQEPPEATPDLPD